ncbi:MAG: hypothetical protein AAFX94_20625, partial [Myxococcota bacterium]
MIRGLLVGTLALSLAACGEESPTEVRVSGAIQAAQSATAEPIDRLTLNVVTATETLSFELSVASLSGTVALPSGALTLEIVAERAEEGGAFTPVYFGDTSVFI